MDGLEYSPFKIIHYLPVLREISNGNRTPFPVHLQISPTNRCNHHCVFCAYRIPDYPSSQLFDPKDEIPADTVYRILEDAANNGTLAVQFTGGGEPLLHPRIEQILEKAVSVGLKICLVSNGSRMTKRIAGFLAQHASWVRISLDSSSRVSHQKVHQSGVECWDEVLSGITDLVEAKKCQSGLEPIIGVGFVVCKANLGNLELAAYLAKHLCVDNIRFSMAFTGSKGGELNCTEKAEVYEEISRAKKLNDEDFRVFDFFPQRLVDSSKDRQDYDYCAAKDLSMYVGADSVLYSCCTLAYNNRGIIGSLADMKISELLSSEPGKRFFSNHDPSMICQNSCMYREKNELAIYSLTDSPRHVEFV